MKHSRICACGYRVAGGTLCACQKRKQAARPTASQRGYGTDWQALRAATPHTPCKGCSRPWKSGFHLDHKLARNAGGTDDASNLHWLCHSCHSRKTAKQDGGFGHSVSRMVSAPDGILLQKSKIERHRKFRESRFFHVPAAVHARAGTVRISRLVSWFVYPKFPSPVRVVLFL